MLFVSAFVILLSRNFRLIFKRGLESFQLNYSQWNYCIIICYSYNYIQCISHKCIAQLGIVLSSVISLRQ